MQSTKMAQTLAAANTTRKSIRVLLCSNTRSSAPIYTDSARYIRSLIVYASMACSLWGMPRYVKWCVIRVATTATRLQRCAMDDAG